MKYPIMEIIGNQMKITIEKWKKCRALDSERLPEGRGVYWIGTYPSECLLTEIRRRLKHSKNADNGIKNS